MANCSATLSPGTLVLRVPQQVIISDGTMVTLSLVLTMLALVGSCAMFMSRLVSKVELQRVVDRVDADLHSIEGKLDGLILHLMADK